MANLDQLIEQMRNNPKNIRYVDLLKVCKQYFGEPEYDNSTFSILNARES